MIDRARSRGDPRKPGNQEKKNRRDALRPARLLQVGELAAVWVPDEVGSGNCHYG